MNKKLFFLAVLSFFCISMMGQEDSVEADTVYIDQEPSIRPTPVPLSQCKIVEVCVAKKCVIVSKSHKLGVYNLLKHANATDIDLDQVRFLRYDRQKNVCLFMAYRKEQQAYLSVNLKTNDVVGIWEDNPDMVASLDECTTLDSVMMDSCQALLNKELKSARALRGEIAVLDVQTGQLKAWTVSEKDESNEYSAGKLLLASGSNSALVPYIAALYLNKAGLSLSDSVDVGSGVYQINDKLTIRDHNWRQGGYGKTTYLNAFIHHSNIALYKILERTVHGVAYNSWRNVNTYAKNSNAVLVAAFVNSLNHNGVLKCPTLKGDTVAEESDKNLTPQVIENARTILAGIHSAYDADKTVLPQHISIAGAYNLINENTAKKDSHNVSEWSFAGYFPLESPHYAICVYWEAENGNPFPINSIYSLVNKLVEGLERNRK